MMKMNIAINFDMDGTIADLYGVENWLEHLINGNTFPYEMAKPLIADGMNLHFEYSPESFMGTEMDFAVDICQAVLEHLHATPDLCLPWPLLSGLR